MGNLRKDFIRFNQPPAPAPAPAPVLSVASPAGGALLAVTTAAKANKGQAKRTQRTA
ncbi:MAG: hypothetical protein V3U88_08170 [Methylococcales bacterium]